MFELFVILFAALISFVSLIAVALIFFYALRVIRSLSVDPCSRSVHSQQGNTQTTVLHNITSSIPTAVYSRKIYCDNHSISIKTDVYAADNENGSLVSQTTSTQGNAFCNPSYELQLFHNDSVKFTVYPSVSDRHDDETCTSYENVKTKLYENLAQVKK